MTFTELVVTVAKDSGKPRTVVSRILRSFIKTTQAALMSEEKVTLREFGFFFTSVPKRPLFGTVFPEGHRVIKFKESRRGKTKRSSR